MLCVFFLYFFLGVVVVLVVHVRLSSFFFCHFYLLLFFIFLFFIPPCHASYSLLFLLLGYNIIHMKIEAKQYKGNTILILPDFTFSSFCTSSSVSSLLLPTPLIYFSFFFFGYYTYENRGKTIREKSNLNSSFPCHFFLFLLYVIFILLFSSSYTSYLSLFLLIYGYNTLDNRGKTVQERYPLLVLGHTYTQIGKVPLWTFPFSNLRKR